MFKRLEEKLIPIFNEDVEEWEISKKENDFFNKPLFWYGASRYDLTPVVNRPLLRKDYIYIFSDYYWNISKFFKDFYYNCFNDDFILNELPLKLKRYNIQLNQIIPFALFTKDELNFLRKKYGLFDRYPVYSFISDNLWHVVYLDLTVDYKRVKIFYFLMENLFMWKEVIEKFNLNIEVFCALRVRGKSGSWFVTHSKDGKLFKVIEESNAVKPKYWIADINQGLPENWVDLQPSMPHAYGLMHFYKTNW